MTDNERWQIVSRIRKILANTKEAYKINDQECKAGYLLGEYSDEFRRLCREIEAGTFPEKGR